MSTMSMQAESPIGRVSYVVWRLRNPLTGLPYCVSSYRAQRYPPICSFQMESRKSLE